MKRIIIFTLVSLLSYALLPAQEKVQFTFRSHLNDEEYKKPYDQSMGSSILGTEVARKMYIVRNTFTYVEEPTPTSPTPKTIIRKPRIYNSVKKLVSYYEKMAKKGLMPVEQAAANATLVLDKAYSAFYGNSDNFEQFLKSAKKPEQIEEAFKAVILE
ncbi:MAG TPA: hypothetical protein PLC81_03380 [Bacteroidales bacterium]|nr:hypothetical protein [Bacteroidales bacterium]HQK36653.1 hypothetical protein [Bacteroidales bacterium]